MKHSSLYNTHKRPEIISASPPLLQGRAPPAIAEISLVLQHSLQVNYQKILHSFHIKFQLFAAGSSNLPTKKDLYIPNMKRSWTRNIQLDEPPCSCCTLSCCASSAGNVESSYQDCEDHPCCGNMHLTISSFQDNLRIPEDVSNQLLHCNTEMDLSARDLSNKDSDKPGQTSIHV